jgi:hypothetical protein
MSTSEFFGLLQQSAFDWEMSVESPYIFKATLQDKFLRLRLNDFPDDPLCMVIVDGTELDLQEFPSSWTLPRHRKKK